MTIREELESAWLEIHHAGYEPENEKDTCEECNRFKSLLNVEAYTEAALMMTEIKNHQEVMDEAMRHINIKFHLHVCFFPSTHDFRIELARALISVIKSKENPDGRTD